MANNHRCDVDLSKGEISASQEAVTGITGKCQIDWRQASRFIHQLVDAYWMRPSCSTMQTAQ